MSVPPPTADIAQLTRFTAALFAHAEPGTYVSLRAFPQFGADRKPTLIRAVPINGDLSRLADAAAAAINQTSNSSIVFAPPICTFTNPDRARTEDLANGLTLSVEIDEGDTRAARAKLEFLLGPATLITASGGEWVDPETGEVHPKLHIHWRLSEPTTTLTEHERLRSARDGAARLVGADPTGKPVVHPLRWPGSWNVKADVAVMARIVGGSPDAEINLAEAAEAIAEAVEAAGLAAMDLPVSGAPEAPPSLVASAMAAIPNPDLHYDDWIRFGYAVHRATGGTGYGIWEEWSQKSAKFDATENEAAWRRIGRAVMGSAAKTTVGAGTIFFTAKANGWVRADPEIPEPPPDITDPGYWNAVDHDRAQPTELPEPNPEPNPSSSPAPSETRILDPWNALRPVTFPADALPRELRGFVENRARIIGADPAAIAWACLCACSAAIDGRTRLQMKRHDRWAVSPALWVALIGDPSTKKSPIIDTAWHPLHRIQNRDLAAHQRSVAHWKSIPKEERGRTPEPLPPRRLVSHDATMEALQTILSQQDRGIGVNRDELAGWLGSMEKYAPGKGGAADRAFWLQAYNGGSHVVDRVGRGTVSINNLLAVICGGIQPDRLRQFSDLTDDGLWQRFCPIIVAPGAIGEDEYDPESETYEEIIHRLLAVPPDARLCFDDNGHAIREDMQNGAFRLEQSGALGARFTGFCGKLLGMWGRLCLVLHLIDFPEVAVVSGYTADMARTLILRSVLPNAARVYTAMGGAGADIEATQSIAGYILTKRLTRIVMSDLTSGVRVCRNRTADDVRKLLSPLEAGGWLRPEREFNPTAWMVSDYVHQRFAAQAEREGQRREMVRTIITGSEPGQ